MFTITIHELAQKVNFSKSTLNRYIDIGLIEPARINSENNYRYFDNEVVRRLELLKILKRKPFRLKLQEIKDVLNQVDLSVLESHLRRSEKDLLDFLISSKYV